MVKPIKLMLCSLAVVTCIAATTEIKATELSTESAMEMTNEASTFSASVEEESDLSVIQPTESHEGLNLEAVIVDDEELGELTLGGYLATLMKVIFLQFYVTSFILGAFLMYVFLERFK